MNQPSDDKDLQGEGNYDATRRYDKAATEFAKSGKVEEAARAAQPQTDEEAAAMKRAEEVGKSHAKGEDPSLDAPKPGSEK
jgi:hypothetical protein